MLRDILPGAGWSTGQRTATSEWHAEAGRRCPTGRVTAVGEAREVHGPQLPPVGPCTCLPGGQSLK